MATFPTDFAQVPPARTAKVYVDNGTISGWMSVADLLSTMIPGDIYTRLLSLLDPVEDVASNVTSYDVVLLDNAKRKRFLCSGACVVNVPLGLPTGFAFSWQQKGAGTLTFQSAAGAGQTIESPEGLRSGAQLASGELVCMAPNLWALNGYTQV